jgi:hypothetical protein
MYPIVCVTSTIRQKATSIRSNSSILKQLKYKIYFVYTVTATILQKEL